MYNEPMNLSVDLESRSVVLKFDGITNAFRRICSIESRSSVAILYFQQEGSLCAQHALNALLQGNYFTAIDLAELARQLDESERARMAEGGETEEFHRFVQVMMDTPRVISISF